MAFAMGLEANIFLGVLDTSNNGFEDPGASTVGEALKIDNVLEELDMSNNHISAVGALSLGLRLRVNQTLRILAVILPGLCIKTAAHRVEHKQELLPVFRPSSPLSAPK
ncbi:hypothetical protein HPG69_016501, partial [Diceros bicornis minor]